MRQVVVTGLGCISALGHDAGQFRGALAQGEGGIRPLEGFDPGAFKVGIAAQVRGFRPEEHFSGSEIPLLDRHVQFALVAAREAVADAGLSAGELKTAAAVVGTGCGGKETDEITYHRLYRENSKRVHPLTIPRGMPCAAAGQISMQMGITGPVYTVSSACASANHAVSQAVMLIRSGLADVAVTGGADAPFTYGLIKAWEAMRVLTRDTCRPFSADRSGMVLGEGAGMVVLESLEHARSRGARIHAELAGIGMSSDAGHITDPSVEGALSAMTSALKDARIAPGDVDYVNAHGTGTRANDVSETQALKTLFREHAYEMAVSSTKSMHGHALGAAGGLELIATIMALQENLAPPTMNFTEAGEGCDLDYVPNASRAMPIEVALSNSFAFGGLNSVLALKSV